MTKPLVIVGAGGFGREVIDVVDAINRASETDVWKVVGVLDDDPSAANLARLERRNVEHLGAVDDYLLVGSQSFYVVGIGSPGARRLIVDKFDRAGWSATTLVHPSATMGFDVRLAEGDVICAGVRLTTNIRVGRHVHLNPNATVGHDTVICDYVSVNPHASISGDCVIESGVLIGVAGVVLNGLTIHEGATVGGSACVVRDVPSGAVVKGVPAR